jgi:hypothetical protein
MKEKILVIHEEVQVVIVKTEIVIVRPISIIGKQYRVKDNSNISVVCQREGVHGRLYGCVTEIISDPYIAEVRNWSNELKSIVCIKVRSLDSGLIYQVPFYRECIVDTPKMQHETILGRTLKVNDNSYNAHLATMTHGNLFRQCVTIVSEPYLWFDNDPNPKYAYYHLMVDVVTESGNKYRVLFNEDGLIDKYNKTFCP